MESATSFPATVPPSGSRRRVVRHRTRPTRVHDWDTALSELPPEIRPAMIDYVKAKRAEYDARQALSTIMTEQGLPWYQIDSVAHKLAFAD